ncbi:Hsp90 protein-domain-containing protein [Phascolomyces articulosus]|uniref:Hsp90 protein-domain-containing protein n=1 Tax=Phascolomyces articulosus TaxID=60185 RepID=A0AAD5KHL7_9FUNG|nr:Hsp90 protein-domain-containing protein [Phascolomyces articulosus]
MTAEQVEQLEDTEKFTFQTEISRLMSLIINSLYKTREIFLRELISNASDALDKIRFMALTDSSALAHNSKLSISIAADPESKTITITDTGIGMTREQLKQNLGTIAKSGTSEFLAKVEGSKDGDVNQIGQFGVGFYSVFLVADKVTVASKSNDDEDQYVWSSQAVDDFVIAKDPRGNTLGRGTQITLHLKEDAEEFLNENALRDLVTKYSEFINFPIYLWSSHEEEVAKEATEKEEDDEIVEESLEEEDEESTKKEEEEVEKVTVFDWERINTQKPIWMRNAKEVEEDEYVEFYRAIAKEPSATPISWTHVKGEGDTEYRSIMYIPPKVDPNFFQNLAEKAHNVRLFVKRVFITDEFELFPKWLSFLKGIVDADDLPLNVSRETLQQHRALRTISKHLVKKALDMFQQLAKDNEEKYGQFFKEYGSALKYGAIESNTHRKKIAGLLRFSSSYDPTSPGVSLDSYISRMKGSQSSIFYLSGMSVEEIEQSPFLERLLARGYEVLYLTEPIDEMLIQNMPGYNGKMFANVAKGDLKFGDEEELDEQLDEDYDELQAWLKTTLADEIDKVVLSKRLTTSPMAIVAADFGLTGHMERLMAAQGQSNKDRDMMLNFMKMQKKTLEINPKHPIIKSLAGRSIDEMDEDTKELVLVLYETTAIRSGYPLADINAFTKRVETIIRKGVGASLDEEVEVDVEAAPEKSEEEKKADEAYLEKSDDIIEDEDAYLHDEL